MKAQRTDLEQAEKKISNACWAGVISAGITGVVAFISMGGGEAIAGIDSWAFADVALILGLTFGIWRRSRTCAVLLFIYFVGSKLLMWSESGSVKGLPLALVFIYYYGQGVVGTFQYHSLDGAGPATSTGPSSRTLARQPAYKPAGGSTATPWLVWSILASFALAAGAGAWYLKKSGMLGSAAGMASAPTQQDIEAAVATAVGRLNRVEVSGTASPLSAAIAVDEGIMLVPCRGITPGAHLFVKLASRDIQARLEMTDAPNGLCKLTFNERGSPLPMSPEAPKVGDAVFAAGFEPGGKVVVSSGKVMKLTSGARGTVIESSARATAPVEGSPLLDSTGRVLAITIEGQDTMLPAAWTANWPAR